MNEWYGIPAITRNNHNPFSYNFVHCIDITVSVVAALPPTHCPTPHLGTCHRWNTTCTAFCITKQHDVFRQNDILFYSRWTEIYKVT